MPLPAVPSLLISPITSYKQLLRLRRPSRPGTKESNHSRQLCSKNLYLTIQTLFCLQTFPQTSYYQHQRTKKNLLLSCFCKWKSLWWRHEARTCRSSPKYKARHSVGKISFGHKIRAAFRQEQILKCNLYLRSTLWKLWKKARAKRLKVWHLESNPMYMTQHILCSVNVETLRILT
jgi:hypothetical protein